MSNEIINFDKIIKYFNDIYHERYRYGTSVDHITSLFRSYFINHGVIDKLDMENNIKTAINKIKNKHLINDVYDLITYFLIYIKKNETMELIHNTQILKYEYYENDSISFYTLLDDIIENNTGNIIYGQYNNYVFNITCSYNFKTSSLIIKNIISDNIIIVKYQELFNFFTNNNTFTSSNYIIFITLIYVDIYNDKYTTLNKIIRNYSNIIYEYEGIYVYGFLYDGLITMILNDNIKIIFKGFCEYNYINEGHIIIMKNDKEILNFSIEVINIKKNILIHCYYMYSFNQNKINIIQGYFNNNIFTGYISLFEDKKIIYVENHNISTNISQQLEIRTTVINNEIIYVYSKGTNYLGRIEDIIKYKYTIINSMKYVGAWNGYGKIYNISKKTCHNAKSIKGNVLWDCEKCQQHIIECDESYYNKKYLKYKKKYFKLLINDEKILN